MYLTENNLVDSRTDAKNFILAGAVSVDGRIVKKPAFDVLGDEEITVDKSGKKYVINAEEYKLTKLDAVAQFSNPGDSFYVVFYNHSPNKIILIFSAKTHTYKDNC